MIINLQKTNHEKTDISFIDVILLMELLIVSCKNWQILLAALIYGLSYKAGLVEVNFCNYKLKDVDTFQVFIPQKPGKLSFSTFVYTLILLT